MRVAGHLLVRRALEDLICAEYFYETLSFVLLCHGGEVVLAKELLNQQVCIILRFCCALLFPDHFLLGFTGGIA